MALILASSGAGLLSVTASPPYLSSRYPTTPFSAGPVAWIVAGGSGSYTYSCSVVEDESGTATPVTPTAANTSLRYTGLAFGQQCSGTLTCTVTDTSTGLTASVDVPFSHERS